MYTLTYLDTAASLNHLLHDIVAYERERLTCVIEGSMRTQNYARADRSAINTYTSGLSATDEALIMHFQNYAGDDAANAYLELTPVALRRSLGMVGMLRSVAQAEGERNITWSYAYDSDIDADTLADWRNDGATLFGLDNYLYGIACEINDACIGFVAEVLD